MSIFYIRSHSVTEHILYYSAKSQYISDNTCHMHVTQLSISAVYHTVITISVVYHCTHFSGHDTAEILLKVALLTITLTLIFWLFWEIEWFLDRFCGCASYMSQRSTFWPIMLAFYLKHHFTKRGDVGSYN